MRGLIIVYTGNGKGKTTAALGLAMRAVGWNKKVLIVQFLKKQETGELKYLKSQISNLKSQNHNSKLKTGTIKIEQSGTKEFVDSKKLRPIDFQKAEKAWKRVKGEVRNPPLLKLRRTRWDIVILDEINVAIKFGLISKQEVIKLLKQKPKEITMVLTGRWASPEIIEIADLVTEFKEIKHPFNKGKKSQKGIDC